MEKLFILFFSIGLSGITYAEKFHCRITDVQDYDTKNVIDSSPKMAEFITETDEETNLYFAGEVANGISGYEGSRIVNTDEHTPPFIVISNLDNKFFGMYIYRKPYLGTKEQGYLVSGFCKKISSIF